MAKTVATKQSQSKEREPNSKEQSPQQEQQTNPYSKILSLQRMAGNRAVTQILGKGAVLQRKCACGSDRPHDKEKLGIQTKLKINEPGDRYEQEADRVAEQVLAAPTHSVVSQAPPCIQRLAGQPTGQADTAAPASVDRVLASPGRPLDPALQHDMGQRFGHDFSQVRIHTGTEAERSALDVSANAYTVGHNVVFGAGQFSPETHEGRRLIAHELTHTIHQNATRNLGTDAKRGQFPTVGNILVQRDGDFNVPTLDDLYKKALQTARETGNWQNAAEKLNGFNREDILNRLALLTSEEVGYLHQGALANPRVGPDSQIAQMTKPGTPRASTVPPSASTAPTAKPTSVSDRGVKPAGVLKVGDTVISNGLPTLAPVAGVLIGGNQLARGVLTVNGAVLGGGTEVIFVQGGAVTETAAAVETATEVSGLSATALRQTLALRASYITASATAAAETTAAEMSLIAAATSAAGLGAIGLGFSIGVGVALTPFAIAYAAQVLERLGPYGGTLPPGGLPQPPMQDPGDAGAAEAPGSDSEGPAYAPGAEPGGPAIAPGAANTPATAPGQSSGTLHLGGKRIRITPSRAKRLEKAEKVEKWTDLPGRDRTSLGKAYNHIIQTLLREIAAGGRATVLHYPKLTKALIAELAKKGGRAIITEGILPNGGRFDIAEINFENGTAEVVDITAVTGRVHGGKTADYASEISKLTGFPVTAYEGQYVDGNELSDEIIIVEVH